jgi:hypothetical protein
MDALAAKRMRFTDAHCAAAVCTPTRYALLTGQYAWQHPPAQTILSDVAPLATPLDRLTVPKLFRQAQYATAAVGKWYLGVGEKAPEYNAEIKPASTGGDVYVFAAEPSFRLLARNKLGELVRATPAVDEQLIAWQPALRVRGRCRPEAHAAEPNEDSKGSENRYGITHQTVLCIRASGPKMSLLIRCPEVLVFLVPDKLLVGYLWRSPADGREARAEVPSCPDCAARRPPSTASAGAAAMGSARAKTTKAA